MPTLEYSGPLAGEIQRALTSAFASPKDLSAMVIVVSGRPLEKLVSIDAALPTVVHQLCERLDSEGDLERLLRGAHERRPGNEKLAALHDRLFGSGQQSESGKGDSLYARCVINGEDVFFDRAEFRNEMEQINRYRAKRILVVKGKRKSGKSYSKRLIRFVARETEQNTVSVNLKRLDREQLLRSLATLIVTRIKPDASTPAPSQGNESGARWVHHPLTEWTLGWMQQAQGVWWIMVDEFDKDVLPRDVYAFLSDLAMQAEDDIPNCRFAMLGYDLPIPPEWEERHRLDEVSDLSMEHVEAFFRGLYASRGLPPETDVVEELAAKYYDLYTAQLDVYQQDESGEALPPLEFLNKELSDFLKDLARTNGGE